MVEKNDLNISAVYLAKLELPDLNTYSKFAKLAMIYSKYVIFKQINI